MRFHQLDIINGHPVAHTDQGLAIIDTGSPLTMPAPASVSDALGIHVDWIYGTDRLARAPIVIDEQAGEFVEEMDWDWIVGPARVIPLRGAFGIRLIPFTAPGGPAEGFLDSGAKLSYAPAEAVAGRRPAGSETDFYPGFGAFEVDVFRLAIDVGGRKIEGTFGVLPPMLRTLLSMLGATDWILGSDVFRNRRILLDLSRGRYADLTGIPTPAGSSTKRMAPDNLTRVLKTAADYQRAGKGPMLVLGGRPFKPSSPRTDA